MRLSLNETYFLIGTVLRAQGFPYGALGGAVRMVQWAEIFHGVGVSFLERRRHRPAPPVDSSVMTLTAETATAAAIDAGGQSALLAGPLALDLATERARTRETGIVSLTGLSDLLWLGQLAEQAAKRGLACAVSFQADGEAAEARLLGELYSRGRSIVAVPLAEEGPLWIEMASAPASHDRLLSSLTGAFGDEVVRLSLTPAADSRPGATVICRTLPPEACTALVGTLRAAAGAECLLLEPAQVAALHRRAVQEGFEVDPQEYYPLARFGLTTVIPSSDESRRQAGADG